MKDLSSRLTTGPWLIRAKPNRRMLGVRAGPAVEAAIAVAAMLGGPVVLGLVGNQPVGRIELLQEESKLSR